MSGDSAVAPTGPARYLRLWVEMLALCWSLHPARTGGLLLVKTVSAANIAATALALRATVNGVTHGDTTGAAVAATVAAATYALNTYFQQVDVLTATMLVDSVGLLHLRRQINAEIIGLRHLDHLESTQVLDRITVVQNAGWHLVYGTWTVVDVLAGVVRLVLVLALLGGVDPRLLTLLAFAAVPLWLDRRGQRAVSRAETETAEARRLQRHLFNLATEAAGGKEVRVAGAGEELARRQALAWDEAVRGRLQAGIRAAGWKVAGWALFTAAFAAGLAILVHRTADGHGSVGDLVLAITIAVTLRDSVHDTLFRAARTASSGAVIDAYLWLRAYVRAEREAVHDEASAPTRLREGIVLDRVSFAYPGTDRLALDDVSVRLPAGKVVAIVGEYGSGKTSLVKLLCKFYRPDTGTILVDDVDLAQLDTAGWRARTSAAFQDFGRFQIRFGETIGIGDLPRLHDDVAVSQAVRAADADALLRRLPDGLDTQLGRQFDGVDLSEGQWQKTALARASMRQQPLLFVLDEPTASLDAPSEQAIFSRYITRARELAARTGAITVIVSHRFSTVADADLVLVLHAGRLVESGTHDELLSAGGRYAELYGIQATAYSST